jgi:hypothetical protein
VWPCCLGFHVTQDALEYLIKWKGVSYMHVEWVTANLMREYRQWGVGRMQRMVTSEEGQVRTLACMLNGP